MNTIEVICYCTSYMAIGGYGTAPVGGSVWVACATRQNHWEVLPRRDVAAMLHESAQRERKRILNREMIGQHLRGVGRQRVVDIGTVFDFSSSSEINSARVSGRLGTSSQTSCSSLLSDFTSTSSTGNCDRFSLLVSLFFFFNFLIIFKFFLFDFFVILNFF